VLAACTLAAFDLFERLFSASVLSSTFFLWEDYKKQIKKFVPMCQYYYNVVKKH